MQIDKVVIEIKERLGKMEERLTKLEGSSQKGLKTTFNKVISINEFMRNQQLNGDVQRTLAAGYYLEKYEGLSSFNAKDLADAYRRLKIPKSQNINFNYKVIKNIQQGYMTETKQKKDNQKAWALTNSGEKYVENGFQKEKS
jgi:hypothetical protein